MNKKYRFFISLLAAMLCMAAFSSVAYATEGGDAEPNTTANPFTPSGAGTLVDTATDADGKEFYTIITSDEHVFYLVIDRQRSTKNVYFLDAVTEKDLLSLAEGIEIDEPVIPTPTPVPIPEPTSQPVQDTPSEPEQQSRAGNITAVVLIIAVIAGVAVYFIKFHKPKNSTKRKASFDEYDFDEDEYGDELDGTDAQDGDAETEDDES